MPRSRQIRLSVLCLTLLAASIVGRESPAQTYSLRLPKEAQNIKRQLETGCPDCARAGFLACGDADVAYGNAFYRHFFQGVAGRGYLVTAVMTGQRFRELVRSNDHASAEESLKTLFVQARLAVVEKEGLRVSVLPGPETVELRVPEGLHRCLQDPKKPWGCCAAASCKDECCEKGLGSPEVLLTWRNPADPEEEFRFKFHHQSGMTHFYSRKGKSRGPLYYCLTDGRADLR